MPGQDSWMRPPDRRPTVAIIGAGFSGVMTALHLLERPDGPRVMLFDRRTPFARGVAYATGNPDHVLNVRAGNMSAWPDRPDHFMRWLAAARGTAPDAATFATRGEYGRYLQEVLAKVAGSASAAGRLVVAPDEIVGAVRQGDGWNIELGVGRRHQVDALALALGNPPPATPEAVDPDLISSGLYVCDPWSWNGQPPDSRADLPILIIGSGLTMVDVALACARAFRGHDVVALSRRGLRPNAHEGPPPKDLPSPPPGLSPARLSRWLRGAARERGWRAAVDSLRPSTQSVWGGWTHDERRRFLRHARPYWDVHRHRLAPAIAERVQVLTHSGQLTVRAGRIRRLTVVDGAVLCRWTPRGAHQDCEQAFSQVIACTGPTTDVAALRDPLLVSLREQGHIRADALRLGLDSTIEGRLIGADGTHTPRLFGLGPITRGALWEIVAVPDIRQQAPVVAAAVAKDLAQRVS